MENQNIQILCKWAHTIYESKDRMIVKYKAINQVEALDTFYFTALGYQLPTNKYVKVKLEGKWVTSTYRGKKVQQFQVAHAAEIIPDEAEGFAKFLLSGAIPGIGKIISERILHTFQEDAYRIMKETPEELGQIKGISPKKIENVRMYFQENQELEKIVEFFHHLITQKQSKDIYDAFGSQTQKFLEESIFRLYQVQGFSYSDIHALAKSLHCENGNDPYRMRAAILEVLRQHSKKGHTCMSADLLEKETYKLLSHGAENISASLLQQQMLEVINPLHQEAHTGIEKYEIGDQVRYALKIFADAEDYLAKEIVALSLQEDIELEDRIKKLDDSKDPKNDKSSLEILRSLISDYMEETNLLLSKEQEEAVLTAQKKKFLIVTGGPGTGKTTIEKFMIHLMKIIWPEKKIMLLAPTGRAARRMAESTGYTEASTIHSAAKLFGADELSEFHGESSLDADILFVDEFSMVDTLVFRCLLKAAKKGTQIIMIGDPDQLPSVQAGNVFKDMIDSGIVPLVRLKHVFRQGTGSLISCNAKLINRGEPDVVWNDYDFKMIEIKGEDIEKRTVDEVLGVYSKLLQKYSYYDVQILTPFRKAKSRGGYRATSVEALNQKLQPLANIYASKGNHSITYQGTTFYRNDKIMESSNQTHQDLSNGDIGEIVSVDVEGKTMKTKFNQTTEVTYKKADMATLSLAYATTIHKSQGSEYAWVIIPLLRSYRGMLSKQLLYTAVTRAKEGVIFVGEYAAFISAVRDDFAVKRQTSLKEKIIEEYNRVEHENDTNQASKETKKAKEINPYKQLEFNLNK